MKYYVQVPANLDLFFPRLCPFTGDASAFKVLRLKKVSTGMIVPIPFVGIYQSNTESRLEIPVSAKVARLALVLQIFSWLALLGGIGGTALLLVNKVSWFPSRLQPALLVGGIALACVLSLTRWWILRKVRIVGSWNDFVEVRFHSEEYARQFSDLNRLSCDAR
jgi:hypothetical protein